MVKNKRGLIITFYILYLYNVYLYLEEISRSYDLKWNLPEIPLLVYFDTVIFFIGGFGMGITILIIGGKFSKIMGVFMISLNLIIIPLLFLRAMN